MAVLRLLAHKDARNARMKLADNSLKELICELSELQIGMNG
jgi:hypothetical protein